MSGTAKVISDIAGAISRIFEYVAEGRDHFMAVRMTRDAVECNCVVIGEAAKRLPGSFRRTHPEIPWDEYCGFADYLIHEYDQVQSEDVWEYVERHIAPLQSRIATMLSDLG